MKEWLHKFLESNAMEYRLCRTIFQGIFGVIAANLDLLIGSFNIAPAFKPMIAALVMAVLSPIMAAIGTAKGEPDESN